MEKNFCGDFSTSFPSLQVETAVVAGSEDLDSSHPLFLVWEEPHTSAKGDVAQVSSDLRSNH